MLDLFTGNLEYQKIKSIQKIKPVAYKQKRGKLKLTLPIIINEMPANPLNVSKVWLAEVLAVFSNDNGKLKYSQAYNGRIDFAFDGTEFIDEDIKGYENSYNYDMHFYSPGTTKYYEIFEGFWIVKSAS